MCKKQASGQSFAAYPSTRSVLPMKHLILTSEAETVFEKNLMLGVYKQLHATGIISLEELSCLSQQNSSYSLEVLPESRYTTQQNKSEVSGDE